MLFDYPEQETYKLPETFPVAAKTAWDIVPEEKAMFLSSTERRTCSKCGVHNGICVCVYAVQIYQSHWKCSKYMVCLCSKCAKINGDVLSNFMFF